MPTLPLYGVKNPVDRFCIGVAAAAVSACVLTFLLVYTGVLRR